MVLVAQGVPVALSVSFFGETGGWLWGGLFSTTASPPTKKKNGDFRFQSNSHEHLQICNSRQSVLFGGNSNDFYRGLEDARRTTNSTALPQRLSKVLAARARGILVQRAPPQNDLTCALPVWARFPCAQPSKRLTVSQILRNVNISVKKRTPFFFPTNKNNNKLKSWWDTIFIILLAIET